MDKASPIAPPCRGCPPCGVLLPPPHPPASHHSPARISLPQMSCVIPKLAREAGKPGSYSPPAAAGQVTPPHDHPKPSCQPFGMQETPQMRGDNPMALHRVFIPPAGIWEKPRVGFPGCGSAFLGEGSSQGVIDAPQVGGVVVGAVATGRWDLDTLHGSRRPGDWSLCPPAWKIQEGLVRGGCPLLLGGCNPHPQLTWCYGGHWRELGQVLVLDSAICQGLLRNGVGWESCSLGKGMGTGDRAAPTCSVVTPLGPTWSSGIMKGAGWPMAGGGCHRDEILSIPIPRQLPLPQSPLGALGAPG